MTYKDGSWGKKAKERSKKRLLYFREHSKGRIRKGKYCYKSRLLKGKTCVICGSDKCFYHHIDGNNKNNAKENLTPICRGCHNKVHIRNPKGTVRNLKVKWKAR